ncbi:MAG: hypothetical protein ACFFE8_12610 [Candidatus Heimdallarchaeota archaeon]
MKIDQEALEHLYVTGEYPLLLEEIKKLECYETFKDSKSIERAICVSYHSRALIRLGEVDEAENLIRKIPELELDGLLFISSLVYSTSIMNLEITRGEVDEAIKKGKNVLELLEHDMEKVSEYPKLMSFWGSFLYHLMGIAYFYQLRNDLAEKYFRKGLELNQNNLFIKAKSLYYMAFLELENGNTSKFFDFLDRSLVIYSSIEAKQGIAWVKAWQGQFYLQKGDFKEANNKISQATELFKSIGDRNGINLVNSLIGLMFYQQGKLNRGEKILEQAFSSSIEIGNPMIASYCLIPLLLLYIEFGSRRKAKECIQKFFQASGRSNSKRITAHGLVAEAIFLKSSSRFSDKARAQSIFLELLAAREKEIQSAGSYIWLTSDTTFSFLVLTHLAELYLDEFKLSEDKLIMKEARRLIDNHIQTLSEKKFSPELIELSLLKAKLFIVEGEIKQAMAILDQAKQEADENRLFRLGEKIEVEMDHIEQEFKKWDSAVSVRERIKIVEIEKYLQEVQKMVRLDQEG